MGHHVGKDLLGHQAHEEDQGNGHHVDGGAPEHAPGCRFFVFGCKGPLPHLGAGQGKYQVGDDIAQDTAVNVGNQVGFIQVLPEYGEIAQVPDAGYGDKDVYKDNQHEKLKHIRVYYAE